MTERATILVVEDNPITRKMVVFTLESNGFTVIDAHDAKSALKLFTENRISLVLQDLMLPDMDGFELVSRLRALPRGGETPVLAFSGMMSKLEEARVSAVGFNDVIVKPVEPSRLVQLIRTHLPSDLPVASSAAGKRVIVADDDPVQRKLVAFRLGKAGYETEPVADGLEALEAARANKVDAIVSDVLMPRLDGFGLCMSARSDPQLAALPIILTTNSYVEPEDRRLAIRAGASDLVLRTPELREVMTALNASMGVRPPKTTASPIGPDVERERVRRVMNQLERQVALNTGMTQRCALLSAELSVLSGISEAVATQHDLEAALHQVLAACFDAGGISVGALYLLSADAPTRVHGFGALDAWTQSDLETFFGDPELLGQVIDDQQLLAIPSDAIAAERARRVLGRAKVQSMLVAPLGYKGAALGALLMVSRSPELDTDDRVVFAQAVAGQISLALMLARVFADKDASETAARSHATVLRSILESMADGVVVADQHGEFTLWNPAAEAVLQIPSRPGDAPTIFASDRVTPLAQEDMPLTRAMGGESVDRAELFVRHDKVPDGAWLSVNARPIRDDASVSHGAVAVLRDVTLEKATQAQLMVGDRMASLGTLAAGVAHEINNPLMAVIGNLDLAIKDVTDLAEKTAGQLDLGELVEELRDAREASERVRQIVRDVKLFSRAEDDRRGLVDIQRALESSLRIAWNEIRHRARLVREYKEVPPVLANESRIGQVFLNLIVNAAQAIPEGRADRNEIRISTCVDPKGRVRVDVTDTGQGMTLEVVSRIFTPFYTTKPVGVGTGLGLAICHQLVTQIGGEIVVDTQVGRGTTFQVYLPASGDVAVTTGPLPPVEPAPRRGRVLVIDDEPAVSTMIRRTLGAEHDVVGLTDPAAALKQIGDGARYDVILCDLMMPNATGMDIHAQLSKTLPDQAANMIFMTGGAFTAKARAFLDNIGNARLEKPFDLKHLRALVNERIASIPGVET
jgi:CheY-like chemotaxis protein/signal transduction histidine kinase